VNDGVNQSHRRKRKEKICIVMFSPNGMQRTSWLHRTIGDDLKQEEG
jgi:hypothetical protein